MTDSAEIIETTETTELSDDIMERIYFEAGEIDSVNCPDCEYAGENVTLQPAGLSASIECPECQSVILDSDQFTKIQTFRTL